MTVKVEVGNTLVFSGGAGTNDGDAIFSRTDASGATVTDTGDVSQYDTFEFFSTGGVAKILVSLDGTNFTTIGFGLTDQTDTNVTPVLASVAGHVMGFRGKFRKIKPAQSGATAVANATLTCGVMGIRS